MKNLLTSTLCLLMLFIAGTVWGAGDSYSNIRSPEVKNALGFLGTPSQENFERSRSLLIDILKKNPKDFEAHMGLVYLRIAEYTHSPQTGAGVLQEALKNVDAALKIKPELEDAYRKKSLILFLIGRKEEGLKLLETALRKWPGSQELHEAYLAYLLNLGKVKEAERFSELEGSRVKNKRDLLLRLGQVWLHAGNVEQADECFEHSLHLGETPQAWAALGRSFMLKKDYPQAIEFFQKALVIDSKHYAIYNDLAFSYFQAGQPRQAIQSMEFYTRAFPNDLAALGNLAGLYEGAGEKVKARLAWMKVKASTQDPQQASLAGERLEKLKGQK
jgi:tetratricopeptide (TPR) repeat protein